MKRGWAVGMGSHLLAIVFAPGLTLTGGWRCRRWHGQHWRQSRQRLWLGDARAANGWWTYVASGWYVGDATCRDAGGRCRLQGNGSGVGDGQGVHGGGGGGVNFQEI
jgi:hypothetical protein